MAEKSNIQHLRDILKEIKDVKKLEEANEFLDAIEDRDKERAQEYHELSGENEILRQNIRSNSRISYTNNINLGLDTLSWRLENGNLKIQQDMEAIINQLQEKYVGVSAYPLT